MSAQYVNNHRLTTANVHRLEGKTEKLTRLSRYAEPDVEEDDLFGEEAGDRLGKGIKKQPVRPDTFSQSSPSRSASDYAESDTDLTDFAEGLELDNDLDLMAKFDAVKREAQKRAQFDDSQREEAQRPFVDKEESNWDVFYYKADDGSFKQVDDLMLNDPRRFHKSVVINSTTPKLRSSQSSYRLSSPTKDQQLRLRAKQSMPNFQERTSPSRLRKSSSSLFDFRSSTRKYPLLVDEDGIGTLEVPQFRKSVRHRVSFQDRDGFEDDTITVHTQVRPPHASRPDLSRFQETGYQTLRPQSSKKFSKIRLIRQLNQPSVDTPKAASGMHYNPVLQTWEGNEAELRRFDSIRPDMRTIRNTKTRGQQKPPQNVGGMRFDQQNLRWVQDGAYQDDPFEGIDDIPEAGERQWSQTTTASSAVLDPEDPFLQSVQSANNCFRINSEQLRSFANEEHKWIKKVQNWFPVGSEDDSYLYELRNFVIQSQRK
ncbi:unnamed protein product [Kuraishia capsulata CBS 1993]|uniref:Uncharacterized protein n=1 Tax=Kuraishia capsulata CBS 1993 TaxID=1382522 RepID=W6MN74_9ASCO|nr:uncharacterized protein KUCA_T00002454001 [Kuraishia capsulata CBS 1993]CDK26482.1 unnamed protein product [Kuraishia capsulata CBS 1993]